MSSPTSSPSLTTTGSTSTISDSPILTNSPASSSIRVRFDNECVLIPEPAAPSRMPRLVKKSYSLPLWRRKAAAPGMADPELDDHSPGSPPAESHLHFTVSVPSFSSKARSPSRGERIHQPLIPCIVQHDHPRRGRRPSLPLPPPTNIATVPLRPCCMECYPITEECIREGSEWQEKFTRAARRRRNSSSDARVPIRHRVCDDTPGFDAIVNVDEVERVRRSRHSVDLAEEQDDLPTVDVIDLNADEDGVGLLPSISRQRGEASTTATNLKAIEAKRTQLAPRILEEQLFPLPTPRRLPKYSTYPSSSPTVEAGPGSATIAQKAARSASPSSPPSLISSPSSGSGSSEMSLRTPSLSSIPIPIPPSTSKLYYTSSDSTPMTDSPLSSPGFNHHSPPSSPIQSPIIPHSPGSPNMSRRRPHMHLPGASSILKASVEVLRGVNSISSTTPLSV